MAQTLGIFDAKWYAEQHPDVALSGLAPLEHYFLLGMALGRAPGPEFDPKAYREIYPDVAASGKPALLHYLQQGIPELRIPGLLPEARVTAARHHLRLLANLPPPERVARSYASFNAAREALFIRAADTVRNAHRAQIDAIRASVIMPVYNRGRIVNRAIESVIAQRHSNWELLIVDDGSSDGSAAAIEPYLGDPRIHLLRQDRQGVSAARNAALGIASGDMAFYLDSDNTWTERHVDALISFTWCAGLRSAYSGLAVVDAKGEVTTYRGDQYCQDQCLKANYIDLNAFCHSMKLYRRLGGFDPSLRRMVDWDLVLRYGRESSPGYAPFIGCRYLDDPSDPVRISSTQPYAYRRVVQARHTPGASTDASGAAGLVLRFAIKIPAPADKHQEWGDFHFAESLSEALRALGQVVRIDFLEQWHDRKPREDDVVIVLRGLSRYTPHPEHVNVMWNISHPDQVSFDEYEQYHLVYVASLSYPDLLGHVLKVRAGPLLQCTDPARFFPPLDSAEAGAQVLFVGNSRARRRPIVDWAVEAGLPLEVYGTRWPGFVPEPHIAGEHIPNRELADHYGSAGLVLNDHWASMADFGFLSNRIFDVLAAGGTLISDSIPSIGRVFGDAVTQVDSAALLAKEAARLLANPPDTATRAATSKRVRHAHSFARRAQVLRDDVSSFLGLKARPGAEGSSTTSVRQRFRIALLLQVGMRGPTSSAFIRLLAPLTTDLASARVELVVLESIQDPRLGDCNACIVQRVAVPAVDQARELVATLRAHRIPLYVDTDDAFGELPDTHPEQEAYRAKDAALRYLMGEAQQVWFATAVLMSMYPPCHATVVPNSLDPRIWRNYREQPRKPLSAGKPVQLLYMGTPTHDADFEVLLPALDKLWARRPGSFRLTLVRAVRKPPARPWLRHLSPPGPARPYPRFAHWLREQGPFDIGLAPLHEDQFNSAKSDIKILDYAAVGLMSVVSDVPAYRDTAPGRPFVVRCANEGTAWVNALQELIDDPAAIHHRSGEAREYLWSCRNAVQHASVLLDHLGIHEIGRDHPPITAADETHQPTDSTP